MMDGTDVGRRDGVVAIAVVSVGLAGLVFVLAHHWDWTLGRTYLALLVGNGVINAACVLRWNPVLFERRMFIGKGTKVWDIFWLVTFVALVVAVYVVATNDFRTHAVDPDLPGIAWLSGAAFFVPGFVLVTWSMVENPFFEKTVRIQSDHGHHVIDRGPYAHIRHPGYSGFTAVLLSTPLLLASTSTLLAVVMVVLALVVRTVLEDRTLQAELAGYKEYATRVRFRLLRGVW